MADFLAKTIQLRMLSTITTYRTGLSCLIVYLLVGLSVCPVCYAEEAEPIVPGEVLIIATVSEDSTKDIDDVVETGEVIIVATTSDDTTTSHIDVEVEMGEVTIVATVGEGATPGDSIVDDGPHKETGEVMILATVFPELSVAKPTTWGLIKKETLGWSKR